MTFIISAYDCLQMGIIFLDTHDYEKSVLWIEEALLRIKRKSEPVLKREDILKHYAFALYKTGQVSKAQQIVSELGTVVDDNDSFYDSLQRNVSSTEEHLSPTPAPVYQDNITEADNYSISVYKSLCNGELYSVRGSFIS